VALLVIVCGAMLVVGGAVSLLMGFDIVMTERGSAMTLGGIIALSGGVITVGIGFALLRLSQILAALQERNVRDARPVVTPDRPVVPRAPPEPVMSGDLPLAPVADSGVSRVSIGTGVVAAGLAASAAAVAAGYSSGDSSAETPHSDAASALGHAVIDEDIATMPALSGAVMPGPQPLEGAPAFAASPPSGGPIPDLEEELARALAEPGSVPPPVATREKSFSDGLSELLAMPKARRRKQAPQAESEPETESRPDTDREPASVEQTRPE
jgi:hypothetical protein